MTMLGTPVLARLASRITLFAGALALALLPVTGATASDAATAQITGAVVGDDGKPLDNAYVRAVDSDGSYLAGTTTDSSGTFGLTARAGQPVLVFVENRRPYLGGYFAGTGLPLAPTAQLATPVQAPAALGDLTLASMPSISGRVTSEGRPVAGARVAVERVDAPGSSAYEIAATDANGEYRVRGLDGDVPLVVRFVPDVELDGWFAGVDRIAARSRSQAVTVTAPATGVDAQVQQPATIAGTVTPGVDPHGLTFWVLAEQTVDGRLAPVAATTTDRSGAFRLGNLSPGELYVLCFEEYGSSLAEFTPGCATGRSPELVAPGVAEPIVAPADGVAVTILGAAPPLAQTPDVTGAPRVGSVLTAPDGGFGWVVDGLRYQWLRDGQDVAAATGRTYTTTPGDLGRRLAVRVTSVMAGHSPASYVADAGLVAPGLAARPTVAPAVTGDVAVGAVLTATAGTWSAPGTSHTFQWLRDGATIAGATRASYAPTRFDVGARLAVRVTAARAGYATGTATSASTARVPRVPALVKVAVADRTITRRQHAHVTVRVTARHGVAVRGKVYLRCGNRSTVVTSSRTGSVSITLPLLARGTYKLRATFVPSAAATQVARTSSPLSRLVVG